MKIVLALAALLVAQPVLADGVRVDNAWVRATAPGQKVAGAFMDLTADTDLAVVGAASPAARVVELHTMAIEDGVMVMRPVKEIALPKGRTVSLKPGGLHVMLIDLGGQIQPGARTPLTLSVRGNDGKEQKVAVELEARAGGGGMPHHRH